MVSYVNKHGRLALTYSKSRLYFVYYGMYLHNLFVTDIISIIHNIEESDSVWMFLLQGKVL